MNIEPKFLAKTVKQLALRVAIAERQLERLNAPQYRVIFQGKSVNGLKRSLAVAHRKSSTK